MGMEKFFDIKCRVSGLRPDCVVMVATVRALKTHGGGPKVVAGRPLDPVYTEENLPLLQAGLGNLEAHLAIAARFGVPVVAAINRFPTDSEHELALVRKSAVEAGAFAAVTTDQHARGGEGARDLAAAVVEASSTPSDFRFLYQLDRPIKEKIAAIATQVYRAGAVEYLPRAEAQIADFEAAGFGYLPICMAKTHLSLSDDPSVKGGPEGHTVTVREVRASVGAGFITPILGEMRTMPGLGATPGFMKVDIDEDGEVVGLT
jgi:methylenetetrahydrofolate dehydrogenase (NADP+)/methenyltetrahydrofolate cyclohydrolase/formyltetrahydrofolate synthetase/formate--tetrahydrofolate ligase